MNVGWNEFGVKWTWGEINLGWNEPGVKWMWGEMTWGEMIWGEMNVGWNDTKPLSIIFRGTRSTKVSREFLPFIIYDRSMFASDTPTLQSMEQSTSGCGVTFGEAYWNIRASEWELSYDLDARNNGCGTYSFIGMSISFSIWNFKDWDNIQSPSLFGKPMYFSFYFSYRRKTCLGAKVRCECGVLKDMTLIWGWRSFLECLEMSVPGIHVPSFYLSKIIEYPSRTPIHFLQESVRFHFQDLGRQCIILAGILEDLGR